MKYSKQQSLAFFTKHYMHGLYYMYVYACIHLQTSKGHVESSGLIVPAVCMHIEPLNSWTSAFI